MKKKRLALCDSDAEYMERLLGFIEGRQTSPFLLLGFTETKKLIDYCQDLEENIHLLVVAESDYEPGLERLASHTLVLNEDLGVKTKQAKKVEKYQQVKEIYKIILEICLDCEMELSTNLERNTETRLLGFYSPVKRAMQTSFALALGKSLATRYKVLYVNFEQYAGWNDLLCREGGNDLLDLMYYLKEGSERFLYRLEQIEQKLGRLSYIPPVYAGQNLIYITTKEWLTLLDRFKKASGYEFVLLDLGDGLQGVFEMLRNCEKVFTVTEPDGPARRKMEQYECMLRMYEYEDVLEKSVRKTPPTFITVPNEGEQWTRKEWLEFIGKVEKEDLRIGYGL